MAPEAGALVLANVHGKSIEHRGEIVRQLVFSQFRAVRSQHQKGTALIMTAHHLFHAECAARVFLFQPAFQLICRHALGWGGKEPGDGGGHGEGNKAGDGDKMQVTTEGGDTAGRIDIEGYRQAGEQEHEENCGGEAKAADRAWRKELNNDEEKERG